jgi:hypothetical protein
MLLSMHRASRNQDCERGRECCDFRQRTNVLQEASRKP